MAQDLAGEPAIDRTLETLRGVAGMANQHLRENRVSVVEAVEQVIGLGIARAEDPVVRCAEIGLLIRTRADTPRHHDGGNPRGMAQTRTRAAHRPLRSCIGRSNDRPSVAPADRTSTGEASAHADVDDDLRGELVSKSELADHVGDVVEVDVALHDDVGDEQRRGKREGVIDAESGRVARTGENAEGRRVRRRTGA